MSRKLVLLVFISFFVITALISYTTSSQSLCNKQCLIPQSGTVYYPNASVSRTLAETVHNLDTGLNYTTIQEAIDAPETLDGHTIFVEEGKYYEHVIVNKSLSLVGENISTTVIDGNFSGNPVTIAASHVNMTSFTVQEAWLGIWYVFNGFGIYVAPGTSYNNISHNFITNNLMYGIMLNASSHNIISDNIIRNNNGSGVTIWSSSNNMIFNNTIENCGLILGGSGIIVFNSTENIVYDNIVLDNNGLGIALFRSGHNQLYNNNMTDNRYNFGITGLSKSDFNNSVGTSNLVDGKSVYYLQGVDDIVLDSQLNIGTLYLINCKNVTIKDLFLSNNSFGLLLWETRSSKIENLTVKDNCYGIHLILSTNITISGSYITNNVKGIWLNSSNVCSISGNNIEANDDRGIVLDLSSNNSILGNNITSNRCDGIVIAEGVDNYIFENSIVDNYHAVLLFSTSNNKFYHNNFVGKSPQILFIGPVYTDYWDNSVEGNYWSDYNGTDSNQDGIGDTSHILNVDNTDHYPLMGMFNSFNTSLGKHVNVISNSTIDNFEYFVSNRTMKLYVSNMTEDQTYGFCRVCIPHTLMDETNISVVIDDGVTTVLHANYNIYDNGTHRWIYFAYEHSTHKIDIIPEFSSFLILPLFMMATLLAVIVYKRKHTE